MCLCVCNSDLLKRLGERYPKMLSLRIGRVWVLVISAINVIRVTFVIRARILTKDRLIYSLVRKRTEEKTCQVNRLTWKLIIGPPVPSKKTIKLPVRGNHTALLQIDIQAEASHCSEQTADRHLLRSVHLRANSQHVPAILIRTMTSSPRAAGGSRFLASSSDALVVDGNR
ncbi:hypothetical protein KC358_g14 [Hortaea werneckii]|nr:hypothetical protein KC358_g14 [Hortaea werneckii]